MSELLNVLIIEDSEDDALLLLRALQRGNFNPVWERVETAESLRTLLTHRTWDVIISDYRLPRFDAPAALDILKHSQLDIPFIVVSGTIGERLAVDMMKAGAHDYLMKENLTRLPEAVRRELRDAQIRAERKQAEAALIQSEAKNRAILTAMPDLMLRVGADGIYRELVANKPDLELFFEDRNPVGLAVEEVLPAAIAIQKRHYIEQALYTGKLQVYEQQIQVGNRLRYEEVRVFKSGEDEVLFMIRDISDLKQVQAQIIHDALHDPLTDLPNRTLLVKRLEFAIQRAQRTENHRYAVLFLDLDRFKVINDSLGHLVGDQLLTAIAQRLKRHLREIDLVARLGGDEFVILLEEISSTETVIQIAERILADCQIPFIIDGHKIFTSLSIGIVLGTNNYHQASNLIRDADIAMYRAKRQENNSYKFFDATMHTQALKRLTLETDLRKALVQEEFVVYYQPIFNLLNNRLIGFEALVRWQHPTRGLIAPNEFIPIAEETGLIVQLDSWVLHQACQQMIDWQSKFAHSSSLKISVNLSAHDLRTTHFIQGIDDTLANTRLKGNHITLEITESMLIADIEQTIGLLAQLSTRNIQISIDDFGTGYSSLSYLHRLPVNYLKIDRSFVSQMEAESRNYQIVSTIIALSNHLGLTVVAEGIETCQQLQQLKQLGCQLGQGFLFSNPLSADDIETTFL